MIYHKVVYYTFMSTLNYIYIALAFTIYHGLTLEPLVVAEIGMPQAPVSTCSTRFAWLVRIRMCSTKVDPLELSCSTSCCL